MPFVPLPTKPNPGGPWLDAGNAWHDNIGALITDVPALRADLASTNTTLAGLLATKAPRDSPTFTGTVTGVTKAMVGLGAVDNTADAAKQFTAGQVVSGSLDPARLPVLVAALRRRTATNEATPTASNWEPRPTGYPLVLNVGAPPAPADAAAGDLHVAPITATTVGTTFTLPDGSAWPSPWTVAKMPTGGAANVQAGTGRLTTGATTGNYSSVDAVSVRHANQAANVDVAFTIRHVTSNAYPRLVLRCDNTTLDPANGLVVMFAEGVVRVQQVVGWSYSTIGQAAKTWTVGTDYRCRVRAAGGTVQARVWAASASEPSTWDVTGTTTVTAAGYYGFWVGCGSAAAAQTASFDDITTA